MRRNWLGDYMAALRQRGEAQALLEASKPGQMAPQRPGLAGSMDAGAVGPAAAGVATAPQSPAVLSLVEAYQKYLRRSGRSQDPLMDAGKLSDAPGGGGRFEERPAATLLKAANGDAFSMTDHGPRAGQIKQAYELADGRKVHVYYDERGRRRSFVFGQRR